MRRFLLITIALTSLSFTALVAQQIVVERETKIQPVETQQSEERMVEPSNLMHKYICRRCGSENQMDWAFPLNKELELIPHCNFCGKKYWPKFKPSGLLERIYSFNYHSNRKYGG